MMKTFFEVNDLVRIKEQEYSRLSKDVMWNENVFRILSIDCPTVKLSEIENDVPLSSIEAIPIDGVADSCIYYDPALAANVILPGQPITAHKNDTSYYVDGLETMNVDDHTKKDEFMAKNFKYVHEVQRWLKEDGSRDELQVKYTSK